MVAGVGRFGSSRGLVSTDPPAILVSPVGMLVFRGAGDDPPWADALRSMIPLDLGLKVIFGSLLSFFHFISNRHNQNFLYRLSLGLKVLGEKFCTSHLGDQLGPLLSVGLNLCAVLGILFFQLGLLILGALLGLGGLITAP